MKGKDAAQAARRRLAEAQVRISELEATLSAERKASREREDALTADLRSTHSKTVQALKAQRDEGLSPMLSLLQQKNEELTAAREAAEAGFGAMRDKYLHLVRKVAGHFESSHGLTALEANDETARFFGDIEEVWQPGDFKQARKVSTHAARAIERARGARR